MSRPTLLARVVWGRTFWLGLAEVPLFAFVAAISIFFWSFSMKPPIDGLLFQVRSPYINVVSADQPGNESVRVLRLSHVILTGAPVRADLPGYIPVHRNVSVFIVDDLTRYRDKVLGRQNVRSAIAVPPGAYLDVDTALTLGLRVGDAARLVASSRALTNTTGLFTVPIGALIEPVGVSPDGGTDGLLVLDRTRVPPEMVAIIASGKGFLAPVAIGYITYNVPGSGLAHVVTKAENVQRIEGLLLSPGSLLPGLTLLLLAILLWINVSSRGFGSVIQRSMSRAAVLVAIGVSPRAIASVLAAPYGIAMLMGVFVGAVVVQRVAYDVVLATSLSWDVILPMVVPITGVGLIQYGLAGGLVRDRLGSERIVNTLAAAGE